MSYVEEFVTVDAVLASDGATRGVDAFGLSLIKAERQIRRLFTYLVFQSPMFGPQHILELRKALGASRRVYFEGFERGVDSISPRTVPSLWAPTISDSVGVSTRR